jgi:outer membrane receptor protein involved in Fe transport
MEWDDVLKSAAYINGEYVIIRGLKMIGGARYDLISDAFTSDFPVADTSLNKSYHAFSPRIALSLSTGKSESYEGSIFVSYGKAFKAPTLDQRTDLKTLNYAMFFQAGPTYQMMIINANPFSNAELKPQRSLNLEIGTYQYFQVTESVMVKTNMSVYQIDVEDEIDFDLQEFRYRNISSSRHRGVEAGFSIVFHKDWNVFASYNYSEVKFASGPNKNNILKGIPKNFIVPVFLTQELMDLAPALPLLALAVFFLMMKIPLRLNHIQY